MGLDRESWVDEGGFSAQQQQQVPEWISDVKTLHQAVEAKADVGEQKLDKVSEVPSTCKAWLRHRATSLNS